MKATMTHDELAVCRGSRPKVPLLPTCRPPRVHWIASRIAALTRGYPDLPLIFLGALRRAQLRSWGFGMRRAACARPPLAAQPARADGDRETCGETRNHKSPRRHCRRRKHLAKKEKKRKETNRTASACASLRKNGPCEAASGFWELFFDHHNNYYVW